jgi:hypothetical protein
MAAFFRSAGLSHPRVALPRTHVVTAGARAYCRQLEAVLTRQHPATMRNPERGGTPVEKPRDVMLSNRKSGATIHVLGVPLLVVRLLVVPLCSRRSSGIME